jgi:hypothetical protein
MSPTEERELRRGLRQLELFHALQKQHVASGLQVMNDEMIEKFRVVEDQIEELRKRLTRN